MRKYFWRLDNVELIFYQEKHKEIIEINKGDSDLYFLILNEDQKYVGYTGLSWINLKGGSANCHIYIFDEFRRKGYGTKAIKIMLEYAFCELRLHKINISFKNNIPVDDFLFKLGFRYEGYRSIMFKENDYRINEDYYGIIESEYFNQSIDRNKEPIISSFGKIEYESNAQYSYIEKIDDYFLCNNLKFRGTNKEDCIKNNEMIFDSQVCRFFDDEVKLPGLLDIVDDYSIKHFNLAYYDERIEFAIEEDNKYVGIVTLCGIDQKNQRTSSSIYIIPEARGRNIGKRAIQFAYSYAKEFLNCDTFFTCVSMGNIASARMMYKAGLKQTCTQREAAFVGGKYVDTLFFELR